MTTISGTKAMFSVFMFLALLAGSAFAVSSVNIAPSKDAYVDQNHGSNNYGASQDLSVKNTASSKAIRTYISFDLSSYSTHTIVSSARVYLRMYGAPGASRTYNAYKVTSSWNETGIAWNAQPAASGALSSSFSTGTTDNVWKSWDVASDVQSIINGTANNGWVVKDSAESVPSPPVYQSDFRSKEYTTAAHRPYLQLNYSCASGWTGTYCETPVATCGNGIVEAGEQCDSTAACCDSSTCQFKLSSAVCGTTANACEIAAHCSGSSETCPANGYRPEGTSCSDGLYCNGAETCDAAQATAFQAPRSAALQTTFPR